MPQTSKIKLTLKGGGLSFARKVDPDTAARVMAMCLSTTPKTISPKPNGTDTPLSSDQEALNEYLSRLAPRRNPDKILAVAGYAKAVMGKTFFHPNEIRNLFRDAGEVLPANFHRDLLWTVRCGWIAKDSRKKNNFYVTNTGEKVLREGFPADLVKKSKNKATTRRKKSRRKSLSAN